MPMVTSHCIDAKTLTTGGSRRRKKTNIATGRQQDSVGIGRLDIWGGTGCDSGEEMTLHDVLLGPGNSTQPIIATDGLRWAPGSCRVLKGLATVRTGSLTSSHGPLPHADITVLGPWSALVSGTCVPQAVFRVCLPPGDGGILWKHLSRVTGVLGLARRQPSHRRPVSVGFLRSTNVTSDPAAILSSLGTRDLWSREWSMSSPLT